MEICLQISGFWGRSSGSARRSAAVSSGHDAFIGTEPDSLRGHMAGASPLEMNKLSSRSRHREDLRYASTGRSTSHLKNYDSALKGIDRLHFHSDERVHF